MLQLLIAIALNPFEERGKSKLLLMPQLCLLLLNHSLHLHKTER